MKRERIKELREMYCYSCSTRLECKHFTGHVKAEFCNLVLCIEMQEEEQKGQRKFLREWRKKFGFKNLRDPTEEEIDQFKKECGDKYGWIWKKKKMRKSRKAYISRH
jgi:hypothetical protein